MEAGEPPLLPEWAGVDLLAGLPDLGLLDDLQVDCGLGEPMLPPGMDPLDGLDGLGLDPSDAGVLGAAACAGGAAGSIGSHPATSDLLESFQLDPFAAAAGQGGSIQPHSTSPSGSGSESPVVLPMIGAGFVPTPALPPLACEAGLQHQASPTPPLRSSCDLGASPATSESENEGQRQRSSSASGSGAGSGAASPSGSRAAGVGAGPGQAGAAVHRGVAQQAGGAFYGQQQQQQQQGLARQHLSEEEKRMARMQRNRENAQLSRQRKKQQMAELESKVGLLSQQNATLTAAVQRLTAENATLRQQLALVCQQAGRNAAAAKAAAAGKPGTAPAAAAAKAGASGAAAAAAGAKPAPAGGQAAKPAATAAAAKPAAVAQPAAKPAAAKPAAAAAKPGGPAVKPVTGAATSAAAAAAARGLLPHWPLLPFAGLLPKVNLAAQQQAAMALAAAGAAQKRPAPGPAAPAAPKPAAAAPSAAAGGGAGGRATKRARTAAGASTAFLALFTLFMFAGPFSPAPLTTAPAGALPGETLGAAGSHRSLQALPDTAAAAAAGGELHRSGRGLRALPAATAASASLHPAAGMSLPQRQQAKEHRPQFGPHPFDARPPLDDSSSPSSSFDPPTGGRLQQLLNSTLQALLLDPGNAQLEAAALQRLQELGPVALLLDADTPGAAPGSNPLAASAAFPQLAGQLFGAAGLEVPQMCQKVLEFDAASVPHAARSRRSLERYVLGATGFRGRSLGAPGTALPAAGQAQQAQHQVKQEAAKPTIRIEEGGYEEGDEWEAADAGAAAGGRRSSASASSARGNPLLPVSSAGDAPVLVSVLLPANASGEGGRGGAGRKLSAIDKVFVVLLHPADKYVTYSCALPRAVVL